MEEVETARLKLRCFRETDADFVRELVNDEGWLRYIGDRGIRTTGQAVDYIGKMTARWEQYGYGAYLVEGKALGTPIGMVGLFRREGLNDPDIGFALLSEHRGEGYALEASAAVLELAWKDWQLRRIAAVTVLENRASIRLLEKLGLGFVQNIRLPGGEEELAVYAIERVS